MKKIWHWFVRNDMENGYVFIIFGILGFAGLCYGADLWTR